MTTQIVIRPRGVPDPQTPDTSAANAGPQAAADPWAAFLSPPSGAAANSSDASEGSAAPVPSGDPWAAYLSPPADKSKDDAVKPTKVYDAGDAAGAGILDAVTFGLAPSIAGLTEAGGLARPKEEIDADPQGPTLADAASPFVGAWKLLANHFSNHPDPTVQDAYERGRTRALEDVQNMQEQHPAAYLTGQIGGALMSPGFGLGGGATAAGRVLRAAGQGAIGTGLYDAGSAISQDQPISQVATAAAKGAATGGVLGASGAGALEGVGAIGNKVASIVRGGRDVDTEAARRVLAVLQSDMQRAGPSMDPAAIAAAIAAGTPRALVDTGGERTRALLRSAANTSPEARAAANDLTDTRFEQQAPRIAGFIRRITGNPDATADSAVIRDAARQANRPAYTRAYNAGDRDLWSPELERLTAAPSVVQSMRGAQSKWRDWQVNDGFGAMNPPVTVAPGGVLKFTGGQGIRTYPNLQFWDYTARSLADRAEQARRAGRREEAARVGGLERQLKAELDRIVPEYQTARRGAASFFNAEDAHEAGRNFVSMNADRGEAHAAIGKMTRAERELFARGFAHELASKIEATGDRRNVVNSIFLKSEAARSKIKMALGSERAKQIEALLRAETVVDEARRALGNSSTARQLAEMGMAGGAVAGVEWLKEGEFKPSHALAAALLVGGLHKGAKVIDERVARRVGELLASNDTVALAKGAKIVARAPVLFNALRRVTGAGARVTAHDLGPTRAGALGLLGLGHMIGGDEDEDGSAHEWPLVSEPQQ